jgi:predicted GNAT family acetyltransferase
VITADVADPVPNAIYRKIGFRPMGERVLIHFP